MSTERGDRTDREILILPFSCFLFIIIYLQILGICFCGLVSPLQGESIETDILGHNKGGVLKRTN
jgi:hypothetical protein